MQGTDYSLHDAYITNVERADSQLILSISWIDYSAEAKGPVESKRTRLIFDGVKDMESQKVRGRSWLSRKPKFFKTARDLAALPTMLQPLQTPINFVERLDYGFVLWTHTQGEYYIEAVSTELEDWWPTK